MENYSNSLDSAFHALSDSTRRAVIEQLMCGPAAVKELAEPFDMGLPSFMKHLRVLENCGLIASEKSGRIRTCHVIPGTLAVAESWMSEQRALWEGKADRLLEYAETLASKEPKK